MIIDLPAEARAREARERRPAINFRIQRFTAKTGAAAEKPWEQTAKEGQGRPRKAKEGQMGTWSLFVTLFKMVGHCPK